VYKYSDFYKTREFFIIFVRSCYWTLSWNRLINPTFPISSSTICKRCDDRWCLQTYT